MRKVVAGCALLVLIAGCGSDSGLGQTNQAPVGVITHDYMGVDAPVTVNFDASQSDDSDGAIVSYEWDFDSQVGNFTVDATGVTAQHQFDAGGTYMVALRVTDDGGKNTIETVTLNIAGNQRPTADITADQTSGAPPLDVNFDASGSSDPDGSITQYEWDFDYDGSTFTVDQDTGATSTVLHQFDTDGTYTVAVRVTDDGVPAATDIATIDITVSSGPVNNAPVIDTATATPPTSDTYPVDVDFAVTYHDDDGDPLTVEWDENYDWSGFSPEAVHTGNDTITLTFNGPGTYYVAVRVTDDKGAYDQHVFTYVVGMIRADFYVADDAQSQVYSPAEAPLQKDVREDPTYDHWDGDPELPWTFFTAPNHPVLYTCTTADTLYFYDTTTPAGGVSSWTWNFGDGTSEVFDQNATHQYGATGIYRASLVVNSGQGNEDFTSAIIVVTDGSTQEVLIHRMQENSDGTGPDHFNYIEASAPDATPTHSIEPTVAYYGSLSSAKYPVLRSDIASWSTTVPAGATVDYAAVVFPVCRANSVGDDDQLRVYRVTTDWQHNTVTWDDIIGTGNDIDTATYVDRDPADPDTSAYYIEMNMPYFENLEPNDVRPYPGYAIEITTLVSEWLSGTPNQGLIMTMGDVNDRSGSINFMNAGRTSTEYSRWLEPCFVIVYTP